MSTRLEIERSRADRSGRAVTARFRWRVIIFGSIISALGVAVVALTVGTSDRELFVLAASGWIYVAYPGVLIGAWVATVGRHRVSLSRSRRLAGVQSADIQFDDPVIGVGGPEAPFSYVQFWQPDHGTVLALYLRPRWPFLPLRTEEEFASFDEALSSEFGRQVNLLRQNRYSSAVARRHFTLTPERSDED